MSLSDDGIKRTGKIYAAYPLNDSFHLFAGLDKLLPKQLVWESQTQKLLVFAYESCCWAFRLAHFKEDKGKVMVVITTVLALS